MTNSRPMVGTGRFELPTCRLGGDRSIHLSYVPKIPFTFPIVPAPLSSLAPGALTRPTHEARLASAREMRSSPFRRLAPLFDLDRSPVTPSRP